MDFLKLTKISIYSFFMTILFSLGMYGFISSLPYWTPEYMDLKYDHLLNNPIPISIQFHRILAYACLVLSIFLWILTFMNVLKLEDKNIRKIYLLSGGIFTWLLLPHTFYKCIKEKYFLKYFSYISQNYTEAKTISFSSLKNFQNKNLFWNTIFGIFVWLVSIVGFLFLFLTQYDYDAANPQSNFLIGELSYFTNLNNWGVFFFMTAYLFFNRKLVFKNNTVMLGMAVYIFVVCMIFWLALFPYTAEGIEKDYQLSTQGPTRLISTIWVHAVTPVLFVTFTITSLFISKEKPKSFVKVLSKLIVFPVIYGVYIFALPFFSQFSVYGDITNLNPGCVPYYDAIYNDEVHEAGSPLMIMVLIGLLLLFVFLIFVFWLIAIKISKQSIKANLK